MKQTIAGFKTKVLIKVMADLRNFLPLDDLGNRNELVMKKNLNTE